MASTPDDTRDSPLSPEEQEWIETVSRMETLSDLRTFMGVSSEHEAYFDAKDRWQTLQQTRLDVIPAQSGFPGDTVSIGDHEFVVHGITHADTPEERAFLHEHVEQYLDDGEQVYCEQGIRPMYFQEFPEVYEMDDYRWAMVRCREKGLDSHIQGELEPAFENFTEEFRSLVSQFRGATFSLIKSGSDVYGDRFAKALGDVASDFLLSHEEIATAEDFRSFRKSQLAAKDPTLLGDLQRYYKTAFLPQPLEREWLRKHDREIELFTHARNERLADYAVAHATQQRIHLIVGAAHQPGVTYYLERHRDGSRDTAEFALIE